MGTTTQRYRSSRDFNWEVISFHCGGWCTLTTQGSTVVMTQGAWASLAGRRRVTNIPEKPRLAAVTSLRCHLTFTLYTMRSCSPSLRVVPSYLISFTKDKANIFSDLSLAENKRRITTDQCSAPCWPLLYICMLSMYKLLILPLCTCAVQFNNTANQDNNHVVLQRTLTVCVH